MRLAQILHGGYFQRPGYFSPITNMSWILPRRSLLVGVTSFCYSVPFLWGAWSLHLIQNVASFMSDYVMTGKTSWFHPIDRVLALSNSIITITVGFIALPWWTMVLLILATYTNYFLSVVCIRKQHYRGYELAHTLWHLVGSASIAYIMFHACGSSFSPTCIRTWVGPLFCNCFVSSESKQTVHIEVR